MPFFLNTFSIQSRIPLYISTLTGTSLDDVLTYHRPMEINKDNNKY